MSICRVPDEESAPLLGGNSGIVVRVGTTVRRPSGPWTPLVHQLMNELRAAGLTFIPEPAGLDHQGREVVEFVDGDAPVYPLPLWSWADELLVDVAVALRQLHDASARLKLPHEGWRRPAVPPLDVICHGDVAPYNTVCRHGRLVAFIDWDYAAPGPRGWDLGYAAYRWVSLTPAGHPDGLEQTYADRNRRLRLFCDAYGEITPDEVVRWAIHRLDDLVAFARRQASAGDPAFVATVDAGHDRLYEADAAWLRQYM